MSFSCLNHVIFILSALLQTLQLHCVSVWVLGIVSLVSWVSALQDLVIVYSSRVSQYIIGNVQPTYYILLEPACHWSLLLLILKIMNNWSTAHWAQIVMMSRTRRGSYNDGDNWPLTLSSDLVRAVWVQGGGLRFTATGGGQISH